MKIIIRKYIDSYTQLWMTLHIKTTVLPFLLPPFLKKEMSLNNGNLVLTHLITKRALQEFLFTQKFQIRTRNSE